MPKLSMQNVNDQVAEFVSNMTGNMWFFWGSLLFIIVLRFSHPPVISELLLDIENDLQLLLLAANAVVGTKQLSTLMKVLQHLEKEELKIEEELKEGINLVKNE